MAPPFAATTAAAAHAVRSPFRRWPAWALGGALALAPFLGRADEGALLTAPELLVPKAGQDLSAYHYDGEVFGWNHALTEVAAIGSEANRGPHGRHRGEAFLLVYPVGATLPIHNINCHVITHADFPDDPVPMDDARDMLWVLENPTWLDMWPVRPKRHLPRGAMLVEPIWDPMDPNAAPHSRTDPPDSAVAPAARGAAPCTPGVGFVLIHRGQRRFVPHLGVDLSARCDMLRMTDQRTYWASAEVAASMVRFDFSPKADNEQSARFVVSAAWHQGEAVHFVVRGRGRLPTLQQKHIRTATQHFGSVAFKLGMANAAGPPLHLQKIACAPRLFGLARRMATTLAGEAAAGVTVVAAPQARGTLTLEFDPSPPSVPPQASAALGAAAASVGANAASRLPTGGATPPAAARSAPGAPAEPSAYPIFGLEVPQRLQDSASPASNVTPVTPPAPPSKATPKSPSYLDDWKVP